jgi:hypothetical protein
MQLRNIKTEAKFYEFGDIWYQRAHNLRRIWQNENETTSRRGKAFILWHEMKNRVLVLHQIAIQMNQSKPPTESEKIVGN